MQNCKNHQNPKNHDFFSKIFFSKKSILKYWFGLCGDLNLGQHTLWDILGPMQGRFFKNMVAPVDGMALQVSASGQKSWKNHDFGVWHPMGTYIWGCEICMESTDWGCYRSWGPTWAIFHAIGSRESDFDIFSSILAVRTLQKHWFWGVSETVRYTQGHIRYYSGRLFEKTTPQWTQGCQIVYMHQNGFTGKVKIGCQIHAAISDEFQKLRFFENQGSVHAVPNPGGQNFQLFEKTGGIWP